MRNPPIQSRIAVRPTARRTVLSAAAAGLLTLTGGTAAEAQWWEQYGASPRRERREAAVPARAEPRASDTALSRPVQGPMIAVVSLNDQRITIYDASGRVLRSPASSGTTGYETPVGLYTIIQKNRDHVSNLYDAEMPFMQRITWSGIALHAGVVPGYPASHGCVRLPHKVAESLFDVTQRGMRVVLVRQDMSPVEFSHPALFAPPPARPAVAAAKPATDAPQPMRLGAGDLPKSEGQSAYEALKAEAEAKAAAAEDAGRRADAARSLAYRLNAESGKDAKFLRGAEYIKSNLQAQLKYAEGLLAAANGPAAIARAQTQVDAARKRLDETNARIASIMAQPKLEAAEKAKQEAVEAEAQRKAAIEDAARARRKLLPVSVLISRATQRIYVRQGFEPVFDAPVAISEPDKPIGTTLFTAMAYEGNDVRWTALSMYVKGMEANPDMPAARQSRRFTLKTPEPHQTDPAEAKAVLDRIQIPEDARARISEVVAPGSSLIVSDEPMHKETAGPGGGTDFIVLMPGEPQGGIAIRPKPVRDRFADDDDDDRPRRRRRMYQDDSSWW